MTKRNETWRFSQSLQQFFTIMEAAAFLRVSRASIYRLINKGTIQTIKISSRMTRITLDELLKLAEAGGYHVIMPNNETAIKPKSE